MTKYTDEKKKSIIVRLTESDVEKAVENFIYNKYPDLKDKYYLGKGDNAFVRIELEYTSIKL